jgi:hypothetical protein
MQGLAVHPDAGVVKGEWGGHNGVLSKPAEMVLLWLIASLRLSITSTTTAASSSVRRSHAEPSPRNVWFAVDAQGLTHSPVQAMTQSARSRCPLNCTTLPMSSKSAHAISIGPLVDERTAPAGAVLDLGVPVHEAFQPRAVPRLDFAYPAAG